MKFNWKIVTVFLTAILLTIVNPVFSYSKIPAFNQNNSSIPSFTIAQVGRDDSKIPWYNCSTREAWSPAKKEWCRKVKKLQNMTYILPDNAVERSSFTLKNGAYEETNGLYVKLFYNRKEQEDHYPLPENNIVFTDLNKDGVEEAIVILGLTTGGSGYWTYMAVVNQITSTPKNIDTVYLGRDLSGSQIESFKVIGDKIQVDLVTHRPTDAHCCPSLHETWTYQLRGNKLVKISSASSNEPTVVNGQSQVEFLNGTWEGTYICRQGLTSLKLVITAKSSNDIDAVFNFFAHPSNPSVPSGSFRMKGSYTVSNSQNTPALLNLKGTSWIKQPPGWITVDLRGNVFVSDGKIIGDVTTPGCSRFELTHR